MTREITLPVKFDVDPMALRLAALNAASLAPVAIFDSQDEIEATVLDLADGYLLWLQTGRFRRPERDRLDRAERAIVDAARVWWTVRNATPTPDRPERTYSMADPTSITLVQQRAAYDALGLDPEQFSNTRTIEIAPHEVNITRYLLNENGQKYMNEEGEIAVDVIAIPAGYTVANPA